MYGVSHNPSFEEFEESEAEMALEIRWMWRFEKKASGAKDAYALANLAREMDSKGLSSSTVEDHLTHVIAQRARRLKMRCPPGRGVVADQRCFKAVLEHPTGPQVELFSENPQARAVPLRNPSKMPDPGPCALLGNTIEWKWKKGSESYIWDAKVKRWLFLWSPKYKAIVAVPNPQAKKRLSGVSRAGGAAKTFERFAARGAKATHEIEIPSAPLQRLGSAEHIVYRSDKWSSKGKTRDYIHEFKNGVQVFCGPSLKDPKVFLCFGGKLTCTERGLVF